MDKLREMKNYESELAENFTKLLKAIADVAVSDTHPVASVRRSCSRLIQINVVELPFTLSGFNGSFGVAHL